MDLFKKNLELLRTSHPALARRVECESFSDLIQITASKDGCPIPLVNSISLHSNYHPRQEAVRAVADFSAGDGERTVVYGLAFGYHVLELIAKNPEKEIVVIEPRMSLFRAFLTAMDLRPFLPQTRFVVGEPPPKLLVNLRSETWKVFEHLPSVRISDVYFERLQKARRISGYIESNSLKVLVVNPCYGGSLPTARYCVRALNDLGHRAEAVECEVFADGFLSLNGVTRVKENAEALSRQFMNFMGQLVAAKAAEFQPDLILALAQAPLTPDAIQNLKKLNVPIVFWFVEDFRMLTYWKEVAPHYDYFFSIQRGPFFDELDSVGAKNHYYLPQACLPAAQQKRVLNPEEREKYSADVSFMGAAYFNRLQSFPRLLDRDFKIWGTGWNLESMIGARVQNANQRIESEETVKIYNAAKINLNLHSSTYHSGVNPDGDFVNPRTFEIAACGGFQLVDERSELAELLEPGEEVATFSSIDELTRKIDHYLEHEEEARAIAGRGRKRVLKEHTLQQRMRELLIHVFTDRMDDLRARVEKDERDPLAYCIEQAGAETELGRYLGQFKGMPDFSLKTITDHIENGKGALNETELLMLMLNQLVKAET